jgi:hypothetical protein
VRGGEIFVVDEDQRLHDEVREGDPKPLDTLSQLGVRDQLLSRPGSSASQYFGQVALDDPPRTHVRDARTPAASLDEASMRKR